MPTTKPEISTQSKNQFPEVSASPAPIPSSENSNDTDTNTVLGKIETVLKEGNASGDRTSSSNSSENVVISAAVPSIPGAPKIKILQKPRFFLVPTYNAPPSPAIVQKANEGLSSRTISRRLPQIRKILPDPITDCPTGHVSAVNSVGETICAECPRGTYRPNSIDINTCRLCSPGYYQDCVGMGYCKQCPNFLVYRNAYRSRIGGLFLGMRSAEECHRMTAIARRNEKVAAVARHGNLQAMHSSKDRSPTYRPKR